MKVSTFASLFLAVACCLAVSAEKFSYTNYKLVRVFPSSSNSSVDVDSDDDAFSWLQKVELEDSEVDIWHMAPNKHADVLLSPSAYAKYTRILRQKNFFFSVLDSNIQNKFNAEQSSIKARKNDWWSTDEKQANQFLFKYLRHSEINVFLKQTARAYPDLVSLYSIGRSYEQRDMEVIKLRSSTNSNKSVWIDCGIHAREWVSPATCVYMIDTILREHREAAKPAETLLGKYEIHILPVLNPDGYEYTHTDFRLWRKNRAPNANSQCVGTDLNRNFDFKWLMGGSSSNPCSDVYAGSSGSSEIETKNVIKALAAKSGDWVAYFSFHSYGQYILSPFGHSKLNSELPEDYAEMLAKAEIAKQAIEGYENVEGKWVVGSSSQALYVTTGTSNDYFYAKEGIIYSYVWELRPGSNTADFQYGFALPENRMTDVATETYLGVKALLNAILNLSCCF